MQNGRMARALAQGSGLAAYTPPLSRGEASAHRSEKPPRRPQRRDCRCNAEANGFWRFFVLRRGLAADMFYIKGALEAPEH